MAKIPPPKSECICIETLLFVPEILNQPKKRWHSAFATIYYSRTLLSYFRISLPENQYFQDSLFSSVTIDVDLKADKRLKIDQNTLLQLLKERSLTVSKKLEGLIPSLIL